MNHGWRNYRLDSLATISLRTRTDSRPTEDTDIIDLGRRVRQHLSRHSEELPSVRVHSASFEQLVRHVVQELEECLRQLPSRRPPRPVSASVTI